MTIDNVVEKIVEISKQYNLTIEQAIKLTSTVAGMLPSIILK